MSSILGPGHFTLCRECATQTLILKNVVLEQISKYPANEALKIP